MKRKLGWIILGLLMLVGSVSSATLIPDQVVVHSNREWVVANGTDSSIITALVYNHSSPFTEQITVIFECDNQTYGTTNPTTRVTTLGQTSTTFTASTKSGEAVIRVSVRYYDQAGELREVTSSYIQKIDHDTPYDVSYKYYKDRVTVGETTPVVIGLTDRWGNPIDNRNIVETVRFAGPKGTTAGFVEGAGSLLLETINVPVNATGYTEAQFRVDTVPQENIIRIEPPKNADDLYATIMGISNAPPVEIFQTINPDVGTPPYLPADGTSKFYINYTLIDKYGNPSSGRTLWINTSLPGENKTVTSNTYGQISITYGPKYSIGNITIFAASVDNPSANCSRKVRFISTAPVSMLLTANPQSMPSLDVNGTTTAQVIAKVIDEAGNPVENQTVTFQLVHPPSYPTSQKTVPTLESTSAITNGDGNAIVSFRPGEFYTSGGNYNPQASANCSVQAAWQTNVSNIVLDWKNYPYLSVETVVNPQTVEVNETIDVTVRLKGDGWALQPNPIEVVLCTDRSGSMLYDDPDRMHTVREAAKVFVDTMAISRDKVGLVSFGRKGSISRPGINSGLPISEIDNTYTYPKNYNDYATMDLVLSNGFPAVKTALDRMVPDHGTPMRSGVYKSVNQLVSHGHGGTVKAIVLLSDGDYNWYGDPLARGTGYSGYDPTSYGDLTSAYHVYSELGSGKFSNQNMSIYARNNNIKIYAIGYADSLSTGGRNTLRILAQGTGGKYYDATASNIQDVYEEIAGDLKEEAGVNTQVDLSFENVYVNNVSVPGSEVFDYLYVPGISTYITSFNETTDPIDPALYPYSFSQALEWQTYHNLHFDVGTIKLGQTWEASFRLKVLKDGNINVFGPGSTIQFNNGSASLVLPETYVTAKANLSGVGIDTMPLTLSNLTCISPMPIVDILKVQWDVDYRGNSWIREDLFYSNDGNCTWIKFDSMVTNGTGGFTGQHSSKLDIRGLPAGTYNIRVIASAIDSNDAMIEIPSTIQIGNTKLHIRLE